MADDDKDFAFPPAIAAGLALAVSVLAAVGLTGGTLTRAIRNDPGRIADILVFIVAVSAVAGIAFVLSHGVRRPRSWVAAVAILLVGGALCSLISAGAESVQEREFPALALSVTSKDGHSEVTVTASGSSLKNRDDMLVQLVGVRSGSAEDRVCAVNRKPSGELYPLVDEDPEEPLGEEAGSNVVLLWQQSGPDQDGNAEVASSVVFDDGEFQLVCGFVSLRTGRGEAPRSVAGYLVVPAGGAPVRRATATPTEAPRSDSGGG